MSTPVVALPLEVRQIMLRVMLEIRIAEEKIQELFF